MSQKKSGSDEGFYIDENGNKNDSALHEPILNNQRAQREEQDDYPELLRSLGLHDEAEKFEQLNKKKGQKRNKPMSSKGDPIGKTIKRAFGGMVPGERAMIPRPPHMSRLGSNDSLRNPSIRPPSGVMRPPHPVSVTHSNVGMQPPRMVNPIRESMPKMPKAGGIKGMGMAKPPMAKSIMPKAGGMVHPPHAGMIHSTIPGRTDKIPMGVKGGSYVIPADVVSGIGEGNSMAGANAFNKLFKMGPYGAATNKVGMPKVNMGHMGGLRPPMGVHAAGQGQFGMEEGGTPGNEGDHIPIIAAGGEFVVPPDRLRAVIHPDLKKAHDTMDHLVLHLRKKTIHQTRKLKPPKTN